MVGGAVSSSQLSRQDFRLATLEQSFYPLSQCEHNHGILLSMHDCILGIRHMVGHNLNNRQSDIYDLLRHGDI